jgi:hypothetical protein
LALFNAHHDNHCFQPIHIFDAATAKPVRSPPRPGKRSSAYPYRQALMSMAGRISAQGP